MTNREKINRALKRKTNDSPKVPTSVIPKREIATVTSSPVVVTAGASLSNNLPAPYPETEVKLIAFYLPQFHPIPENDQWWGKGFTEWTGVSAARPYFEGHYQPHLPADLGFYDLRVAEVREAQANMARDHGIHGFCYYFYWFSGRRILERPLNEMLQSKRPDFPFCVCWANEPWSRRWDGSESELLISQQHEINIDKGLILDLLPLFDDPRYIKVDGKPLLVIYRVALLPDPVALFEHFRSVVRDHGFPGVHICMAETFGLDNPYKFGCDSSLEFPPHKSHSELINDSVDDLHKNYTGNVYKYESVVKNELAAQPPDYLRFRGVMPGWDNTPRRGFGGNVFYGSAPVLYEQWLRGIIAFTRRHHAPSNRIIFINAWNEWGEGAHLEPDRLFGSQYLQATRRAVTGLSDWRTILANARANSADCIDSLNELEALLNSYDASLKFLGDKNLAYEEALPRQKFVPIGRSVQGALEVKLEGSGNIDRINQFEKITDLTLGQHDFLHIIGWVYISGQEVSPFTEGFITLLSADHNKDHFTVRISHRIERPDVVKYVQAPEGEGLWSGVHGSSLVGEIPTGSYTVAIDTKIDKYCYRYMSNKRVHIV